MVGRWVKLERERQAAEQGRPDPREMEAEITALRRRVRQLEKENEFLGKASAFFASVHQNTSALNRWTRTRASYLIALMAKVLGVTRAGYDVWKSRVGQRAQRAVARRRLDEAVAWEYQVSGGTYGAARIQCALTRGGVDVGVRAVAQSMRRLGLTGLHARSHHSKRGGRWACGP